MSAGDVTIVDWPADAPDTAAMVAETVALWEACGLTRPWNDAVADLTFALKGPASTVLLAQTAAGRIVGSVMVGHDGHRGAVYYVAVAPDRQGEGIGRALMAAAEAWLVARGAPKLNLMVRSENEAVAAFYRALGYGADDVMVLSKRFTSPQ